MTLVSDHHLQQYREEGIGIRVTQRDTNADIAWVKDAGAEIAAINGYLSDGAFGWVRGREAGERSYVVQDGTFLSDATLSEPPEVIFSANEAADLRLLYLK